MLPTFVIGLREGVEAALIVGIIAAFLTQRNERKAMRSMWIGVAAAIAICVDRRGRAEHGRPRACPSGNGRSWRASSRSSPSPGSPTWSCGCGGTRASSRATSSASLADALVAGSTLALVGMAFFAVIREGLETAIFMLAAFQNSTNPAATGLGAVLGVIVAVGLGYAIYRGGVRINLSRFFRVTGFVLVLVAAGSARQRRALARGGGRGDPAPRSGVQPVVARCSRQRPRRPAHRHAGPAAGADHGRGPGVAGVRDPHGCLRAVAPAASQRPAGTEDRTVFGSGAHQSEQRLTQIERTEHLDVERDRLRSASRWPSSQRSWS